MAESWLTTELDYFESRRAEWLEHHADKFALVNGSAVHDFFDSWENAYAAGVEEFGVVPFLVKQVLKEDPMLRG